MSDSPLTLPDYAELHCLSNFSFLRGASHSEELVARAMALGYRALAITDECSFAGVVRAHVTAKAQGLKLLIGTELRLADGMKLVLLAQNRAGYGNLSALITLGRRRVEKGHYHLTRQDLSGWNEQGVPDCLALWLSAADATEDDAHWLAARFPGRVWIAVERHLLPDDGPRLAALRALSAASGLPLVAAGDVHMHSRGRRALQDVLTALRLNTSVDAAGHALFPNGERHLRSRLALGRLYPPELLAETLRVAELCSFSLDELRYDYPEEIVPAGMTQADYLRAEVEKGLVERYGDDGTSLVAWDEMAAVPPTAAPAQDVLSLPFKGRAGVGMGCQSGEIRPIPARSNPIPLLSSPLKGEERSFQPFVRLSRVPPAVRAQIEHELALIAELEYEPYFLTVYDIVKFARSRGILCQGRGSAANSAVCYALGITAVDPAESSLLFERFLSRERKEPPDIDVDFEHQRREEVIQYIYAKYGRGRAALAATVITYRQRSALRDSGRALGIDIDRIDALTSSLAWWDRKEEWPERFAAVGLDPNSPRVQKWMVLARALTGFPRHLSQHVGGFVIARDRLDRLVPIENANMANRSVIQWDKDDIDALGLMKVDVLALGMLSAIRRALDCLSVGRARPLQLHDIPKEDPATYAMICQADTIGVFQIESRAQMAMLPRLKPRRFYDLVIEVALVRPGPIQGDMVHPYLRRRQKKEPVSYPSEAVRGVLERTLGVPIFQEQAMQLSMVAAGFTAGEADQLRRAMAAWKRKGGLEPFREKLLAGMAANGYEADFAQRLYSQIEGFGDYGFPESHAASFAQLAYASAWLKCHAPAAFLVGLLNAQPMGFYSGSQLVQDARRHGVEVRGVDVTRSDWETVLEDEAVCLGLHRIKGLAPESGRRIEAARHAAPFRDLTDLAARAGLRRDELDRLAAAGALAALAGHRRQAAWNAAAVPMQRDLLFDAAPTLKCVEPSFPRKRESNASHGILDGRPSKLRPSGSFSRFRGNDGGFSEIEAVRPPFKPGASSEPVEGLGPNQDEVVLPAPTEGQDLVADYAALGLTLGRHPLQLLRRQLSERRYVTSQQLRAMAHCQLARCAGIVTGRQRPGTASGVIFVTLEDEGGLVNVIVHAKLAERQRRELLNARLLGVLGVLQREGDVVHLIARRLVDHTALLGQLPTASRDFH